MMPSPRSPLYSEAISAVRDSLPSPSIIRDGSQFPGAFVPFLSITFVNRSGNEGRKSGSPFPLSCTQRQETARWSPSLLLSGGQTKSKKCLPLSLPQEERPLFVVKRVKKRRRLRVNHRARESVNNEWKGSASAKGVSMHQMQTQSVVSECKCQVTS